MKIINAKNYWCILLLLTYSIVWSGCGDKNEDIPEPPKPPVQSEAAQTMQQLWETSPLAMNTVRQGAFIKIQQYADKCLSSYFKDYMKSSDNISESREKNDSILSCYRMAFDRMLEGIKTETVENGTVVIWMLYNMGYVIKTPSGCFGIDIYHRWAKKLEPYLDFLCITHNHQDHYSKDLMDAMFDANKPVLSNYYKKGTGYLYISTTDKNYTLGSFSIRTAISDHSNEEKNFVTMFRIDCGNDTDNFSLLHVGDSNYKTSQYSNVQGAVNVLVPRYAPYGITLHENNILGTSAGQVLPDYVLLSHILELSHVDVAGSRWPLDMALERASKINCEKTYVPFWGEKLVWKNGTLN